MGKENLTKTYMDEILNPVKETAGFVTKVVLKFTGKRLAHRTGVAGTWKEKLVRTFTNSK